MNGFLYQYISAYRENYSSCHVLMKLIENWKESLDKGFAVGALLMDYLKLLTVFHLTYLSQNYIHMVLV